MTDIIMINGRVFAYRDRMNRWVIVGVDECTTTE